MSLCKAVLLPFLVFAVLSEPSAAQAAPTQREIDLLDRIQNLEQRLSALEGRLAAGPSASPLVSALAPVSPPASPPSTPEAGTSPGIAPPGVSVNLLLDGYYGYNFNRPADRQNQLRAYDYMSNNFSLNQAAVVLERAPDVSAGRRWGGRLDLQFGQATETLQGNPANEPRPNVYRAVFQAYGTYVAPVGSGLTIDFGKWASALGMENNYTKDQMNYSRSYLFNYLPFYHEGVRAGYDVSSKLNVAYWLVNGAEQTEGFTGNKSQALIVTVKPAATVTANVNYYTGVEGGGRLNILDSYAIWKAGKRVTFGAESDYVAHHDSHVAAAAGYARYEFTPRFALNGRFEYFADRGGLFSGATQNLKEATITADYLLAGGFLMRTEWRSDFSDQPYFHSSTAGKLLQQQNTATVGLVWWFGDKKGAW